MSLGNLGASRTIEIFVDGDGACRMEVKKKGGELVKSHSDYNDEKICYSLE